MPTSSSSAPSSLCDATWVERIAYDVFTGREKTVTPWGKVFGGQVLAQSLVATQHTVDRAFQIHSLTGYFLLAGESGVEIRFEVERVRDGRSFATRCVKAKQQNRVIFQLMASFQRPEPGVESQINFALGGFSTIADVPTPEQLLAKGQLPEPTTSADLHGSTASLLVAEETPTHCSALLTPTPFECVPLANPNSNRRNPTGACGGVDTNGGWIRRAATLLWWRG